MNERPYVVDQVSDLHLTASASASEERAQALFAAMAQDPPDRVVITGDLSNDAFKTDDGFAWVKSRLDAWCPAPWHGVPGNHDVGEKADVGKTVIVNADRLKPWRDCLGADRFSVTDRGWRLVGINTLLAGSGLPDDDQQHDWLMRELDDAGRRGEHVACFLHDPLYTGSLDDAAGTWAGYWAVHPRRRRVWAERLSQPPVRLIGSGHVHWLRQTALGDVPWWWCPSVWMSVIDPAFPPGGEAYGWLRHELFPDGAVRTRFIPVAVKPSIFCVVEPPTLRMPHREPVRLTELLIDFNGTLACDGELIPGVAAKLRRLAQVMRVTVATADTFGSAANALADLPVHLEKVTAGPDKRALLERLRPGRTVMIGNGANDIPAMQAAALGVAVLGPEGLHPRLLTVADVVTRDILDALALLLNPQRLTATLRG